ncbi:CUB and LDLa domain [Arctopsyche grandis]|uniref:CUB and LDLa domain n=1 Tax=Arctopsyche grandis TaxID=121162 RepID=UPI00406D68E1
MQSKYLQLGEKGRLNVFNNNSREKLMMTCGIELITCNFCRLELKIEHSGPPSLCISSPNSNETLNDCPCGKILLRDSTKYGSPLKLCFVSNLTYKSSTRSLIFSYDSKFENVNETYSFIYVSRKNQQDFHGELGQSGLISSPNFPSIYYTDVEIEYILSCISNDSVVCVVSLIFTDFFISSSSIMEFFDSDGKLIQFVSGAKARPAYMVTSGPTMTIRFYGNGGSSLGYKATYNFISLQSNYKVNTECGGEIQDVGGSIYMNNVTGYYDCVWIIKPPLSMAYLKTHIYLKVTFTGSGELIIHDGETSNSRIIDTVAGVVSKNGYETSLMNGFYVSYKGNFGNDSKLILAYTAFSYSNCRPVVDYPCHNNRCILSTLICDTIDHCGDNSDEEMDCSGYLSTSVHQFWWPSRTPSENPYVKITVGLWLCGLVFISGLSFITLNKCRRKLYHRNVNNNNDSFIATDQIQTITQLMSIGESDEFDAPPVYEPPPDYSQAIKLPYQKL